jgi:class 3 adenylate cyclase
MQASNRTFICSVVFLDIVEYSKKPVAEQIQFKERLNTLLTEALANVAVNDRIILDTGDGAALSFLGDPEDALFVSLSLRDALAATPATEGPEMKMRIGINLGPVKLVKDINGQPNIIGDGINVAQRVMSFADPGQILVSRSFYEVVSCLSEGYVKLFHYEGSRTDKHVREHEVYAVQATGAALQLAAAQAAPRDATGSHDKPVVIDRLSQSASFVTQNLRRKPRVGTALAVVAILAFSFVLRAYREPPATPAAAREAPTIAVAPPAAAPKSPGRDAVKPPALPPSPAQAAKDAGKPAAATAPGKPPAVASAPSAQPAAEPPAAAGPATVNFSILPWGEVYVDGKMLGVAPPLRNTELKPGRYRIEIRNADFPPYTEVVDVKAGSRIRIRHRFR